MVVRGCRVDRQTAHLIIPNILLPCSPARFNPIFLLSFLIHFHLEISNLDFKEFLLEFLHLCLHNLNMF